MDCKIDCSSLLKCFDRNDIIINNEQFGLLVIMTLLGEVEDKIII